jgi:rhodanese-related sulfurtransferase
MMFLYLFLAFAILISLYNLLAIRSLKKEIESTKDSITKQVSWSKDDLRTELNGLRRVVKILGSGGTITEDMVDEGRPFADMSAKDAEKLLHESGNAIVIDVRSPSEFYAGHIPGAKLIPLDEIEARLSEIPKEGHKLLLVCQAGQRSAAACEILSNHGYINLINIYDGTPSWPGKKEIGVAIRPPASEK